MERSVCWWIENVYCTFLLLNQTVTMYSKAFENKTFQSKPFLFILIFGFLLWCISWKTTKTNFSFSFNTDLVTHFCCQSKTNFVKTVNIFHFKIKCNQYWPETNDEGFYGDISISKYEEKHYAFYVIRKLTISLSEVRISKLQTICNAFYSEFSNMFF